MANASLHDRRKGTLSNPNEYRSILQDRSRTDIQESTQAASEMVSWIHYQ